MLYVAQTALELGFQYALVAMALFLSYRVLDIADLTTDGCFVLAAPVSVTLTAAGHPFLAIPAAMLAGACAGFVTAFLQTKLGVPSILAGIVTNTGLYTVNLMAMGWKANQSLLKQDTIFTLFRATGIGGDWNPILLSGGITVLAGVLLVAFLGTRAGPQHPRHRRQPGHGALLLHQPQFHHHHRPVRGQRPHRPVRRSSGPGPEDS